MKRVLITGVSGTGKSSVIEVLAAGGHKAVDADAPGLSELVGLPTDELTGLGHGKDWVWQEARIQELLSTVDAEVLFVSGARRTKESSTRSSTSSSCSRHHLQ